MKNKDFLTAIFHAARKGETGCIATAQRSADQVVFPSHEWIGRNVDSDPPIYTHFGVGLHRPSGVGQKFKRDKASWTGMALLLLDDVGEEKNGVLIREPDLAPTFIVETKPNSQQWGYVFEEPIRDYDEARALLRASLTADLNDPNGQNPSRLGRLIGSKPLDKKYYAKMHTWNGTRFSINSVVAGLRLDLEAARQSGRGQGELRMVKNGMNYANMRLWPGAQEQLEEILVNLLVNPDQYHWNMQRMAFALACWFGHGKPKIKAALNAIVNVAHASGRIDRALYDKHITKVDTMAAHYAAIGMQNRAEMHEAVNTVRDDANAKVIEQGFMSYAEKLPDLDMGIKYLNFLKKERGL